MKVLFLACCLVAASTAFSQVDSNYLNALYARCMDFSEAKADSINFYANFIGKESVKLKYAGGKFFSLRLHGLYEEYKSDYEKAIDYYLQSLEEARKQKNTELEISELTDLAIVYTAIKQYPEAKQVYLESVQLNNERDTASLIDTYTNLGVVYNNMQLHDSALFFLKKGLRLGELAHGKNAPALSSLYNNLGNTYFSKKEYDQALYYFTINRNNHSGPAGKPEQWVDYLNIADVYIEKSRYDSATKYADAALKIAGQLASRSKESDSYSILAKLYQREGDYKKSYGYLQKWYSLDTAMVNSETSRTVVQLQEQYHARERENEKLLLQAEVDRQIFRSRIIMVIAVACLLVAFFIAWAFFTKRNANRKLQNTNSLITAQNEKLAELNFEKNALISIVSHDLGTPFASIGVWSQLLQSNHDNLTVEQQKSISKISEATHYGENLIRRILDVEKAQTNQSKLHIENIELNIFVRSVTESFSQLAEKKNIQLHLNTAAVPVYLMSDRELIRRICGNLLSNAIKFTHRGKNIWLDIEDQKEEARIRVRDEGIGIVKEEIPYLFSKYSKISSLSTDGEHSTGLGLAIVKRIVEELNGKIFCESEPGTGSVFTVIFKK